jgi:hypothetical protein
MAKIKWPTPAAYIVQRAMAEDRLAWSREPKALDNVPLYTKEQVEKILAAACGVALGDAKHLPMVPTPHMMNAAVNAWHSWKSRDTGGNIQTLGRLMWEHMADAASDGVALPDGGEQG